MNDGTVKRYADAAKGVYPKDPAGFCLKMAEEQQKVWTLAAAELSKPSGNVCADCGGELKQAGSCSVCLNCGETTGCG